MRKSKECVVVPAIGFSQGCCHGNFTLLSVALTENQLFFAACNAVDLVDLGGDGF